MTSTIINDQQRAQQTMNKMFMKCIYEYKVSMWLFKNQGKQIPTLISYFYQEINSHFSAVLHSIPPAGNPVKMSPILGPSPLFGKCCSKLI